MKKFLGPFRSISKGLKEKESSPEASDKKTENHVVENEDQFEKPVLRSKNKKKKGSKVGGDSKTNSSALSISSDLSPSSSLQSVRSGSWAAGGGVGSGFMMDPRSGRANSALIPTSRSPGLGKHSSKGLPHRSCTSLLEDVNRHLFTTMAGVISETYLTEVLSLFLPFLFFTSTLISGNSLFGLIMIMFLSMLC